MTSPPPTTLSTFGEKELRKDTSSFDIFDSDDHDTFGNGRRHSVDPHDGSIFIGNGLASPNHCYVSPSPDGNLATPAPKKIASLLTPPPSGEKTSATSISLQEIASDVSSSEKNLFTLPHEENPDGDFCTLEHGDVSALSHAQNKSGDVAPFKEDGHSTPPHEENRNGDVGTLEPNDLPGLPHEAGHNANTHTSEQNDISTLSHEESHSGDVTPFEEKSYSTPPHNNCDGDPHTLEPSGPSALSHGSHSGHATQCEESGYSTLSQSNFNGDIHTSERNNLPALPHEVDHNGDTRTSEQNHLSTPLREGNHSDGVTQFEENDYSTLPHENLDGTVHTWERDNLSTVSREGNYNGGGVGFGENSYSTLPYENCDGAVHTWERDNLSTVSREGNYNGDGGAGSEENGYSTLSHENYDGDVHTPAPKDLPTLPQENRNGGVAPFEENSHFTLPYKKNDYGDARTPDKTPREPYGASKITSIKEQNGGRQPRGDYWRPSITESRAHSRYGDSYRGKETGGSIHQFRSSVRHSGDLNYTGSERDRRPRSRSPARDIKRGRFRDISPPRRSSGSRDGPYGLSGSNASHQTEDKSGWHRFGNQTFKGDRYIPHSEPTRPARRSPAPSPGRELTPPRRTLRNRSRSRSPPPTLPKRRSDRQPEYTSSKVHPTRSSSALPAQSTAFQNSIRSANTGHRNGAASAFEGGHSADVRNSNYVQARIPTSPKRPEKRRRHEDEPPAQNKRSRRDEPAYNGGRRDYRAPRSYRSR